MISYDKYIIISGVLMPEIQNTKVIIPSYDMVRKGNRFPDARAEFRSEQSAAGARSRNGVDGIFGYTSPG